MDYHSLGLVQPSPKTCHFQHEPTTMYLSIFILIGLLISYIPQHYRIISSKSSHGISPWFLLLGSISSASSLVNVVTLQWGVVRCCRFISPGMCAESMLGVMQVFLQWACFNVVLILSLIYFPPDRKYVRVVPVESTTRDASPFDRVTHYSSHFLSRFLLKRKLNPFSSNQSNKHLSAQARRASLRRRTSSFSSVASDISSSDSSSFDPSNVLPPSATRFTPLTLSKEYTVSLILAIIVFLHFLSSLFITFCLLLSLPKATIGEPSGTPPTHDGEHPTIRLLRIWATCAGLMSLILACFQYLPQILSTWKLKVVGSLSLSMMIIQTPGSFIFVYSLAVRPGVNWTTWIVYLVTGTLQGGLLVLCIAWKIRQKSMGIDDWGRLIPSSPSFSSHSNESRSQILHRSRSESSSSFSPNERHRTYPESSSIHPERRPLMNSSKPRISAQVKDSYRKPSNTSHRDSRSTSSLHRPSPHHHHHHHGSAHLSQDRNSSASTNGNGSGSVKAHRVLQGGNSLKP
ncbi:uncharacterized protein MELLADRAFT_91675 [Melampsora larici-populina 98AG31]|uniref:Uncharacterized protein n=1 Tax=Melampsora larici-populina (strain 98AG31 / pathotype 3-4-7) TaxID=747676 RepID=F4RZW9_MELLP|nr:uncharacterized protein MELLADRAFT_91675 [Melampsora larici-populina 98AG31]EGG02075.1 hypothetical protein MELLADRAFT_91675 [Melampsora larici-populina 98AG31]